MQIDVALLDPAAQSGQATDHSALLEQAYDEYCQRVEAGEQVDAASFCSRFPTFKTSLRRMLDGHIVFEEQPHLLAGHAQVPWPQPGGVFLDCTLICLLGRGAFARVYLARQHELNRLVAIKVAWLTFEEARSLGRLQHVNIVPAHFVRRDEATGLTGICMPYLGSATLCDVLDRCHAPGQTPQAARLIVAAARAVLPPQAPPPTAEIDGFLLHASYVEGVVHLSAQLAEALAAVHDKGICHRDLKPSNVLVDPTGRPWLVDFNLAVAADAHAPFGGTIPYMSPEQLQVALGLPGDPAALDARSDLYSLAVIVYELLAGVHPFLADAAPTTRDEQGHAVLQRQRRGPAPLRTLCPAADAGLERLLTRCLAYDPDERPAAAADLAAALRSWLTPARRLRRRITRRPRLAAALVLALALAGTSLAAAVVVRPGVPQRHFERGLAAFRSGDYQAAADLFSLAGDAGHDPTAVLFARGRALQHAGDYALAIDSYARAAHRQKQLQRPSVDETSLLACIAFCRNRLRHHFEAATTYRELIDAGHVTPALLNNLAYCQVQVVGVCENKTAIALLDKALALEPRLQAAYHNRGLLRARLKDHQGAVADFQQAVALGPGDWDLYWEAACIHAHAGRPKHEVLALLGRAFDLGHNPDSARNEVAFAHWIDDDDFKTLLSRPRPVQAPRVGSARLLDPVQAIPLLE